MDDDVAALKDCMGPDEELVSLGKVTHNFVYYYGDPVRLLPPPPVDLDTSDDWTYFSVENETMLGACNFPYEIVAQIKADSNASPINPKTIVTIGRRLKAENVAARPASQPPK
jgi:hypothetical protein